MKSARTMLGLLLLAASLAAAPARAGDNPEPAPPPPCDVPAYLLSSESSLPKVTGYMLPETKVPKFVES